MVKLMEIKLLWTGPNLRVKVASGVAAEAEVALEAEVVAEEAEVDLVAEAGEALEVEAASEEAEAEEETTSHKERRRSLNSFFYPCPSLFHLKERTLVFLLCYLTTTEPSEDIPRQYSPVVYLETRLGDISKAMTLLVLTGYSYKLFKEMSDRGNPYL